MENFELERSFWIWKVCMRILFILKIFKDNDKKYKWESKQTTIPHVAINKLEWKFDKSFSIENSKNNGRCNFGICNFEVEISYIFYKNNEYYGKIQENWYSKPQSYKKFKVNMKWL